MHKRAIVGLTLFCLVGSGTDGGVYFAFSTFVMKALGQLPVQAAIPAMQQINDAAQNFLFAIALFGTGLSSSGPVRIDRLQECIAVCQTSERCLPAQYPKTDV